MTERVRISGRLDAEGRLTLRPTFPTAIPMEPWRENRLVYVVEVLDATGGALVRAPLSASGTCETVSIALRGSVDLPEEAVRLDVLQVDSSGREPLVLASEPVPPRGPELRLLTTPEGDVDGRVTLEWEAVGDPPPVRYFVDYSCGREVWEPLTLGVTETSLDVDFSELAGGDACRLAVTASNGLRSTRTETNPFRVPLKPCSAVIAQPLEGQELESGVTLVGNGWWREEGRAEAEALQWSSDVQGDLGTGRVVTARLEPGEHRITLLAGQGERVGTSTVSIQVTSD